jgi:RNA polymerase sigma factor (sigma-70 family)
MSLPPFESVIEDYGPALLRFCLSRGGAGQGEDIFQEAMIAALRAYPDVRDPEAIRPWLYAIAARKAIDFHRAAARSAVPTEDLEPIMPTMTDPPPFDGRTWSCVRELPDKQRQAIGLRFLAELSHGEIATTMGISEAAARRNVFEGLRRLRKDHGDDLTFRVDSSS